MITDHKSPHFARDVTRRNHRGKRALAFNSLKSEGGDVRVESALEKNVGLLLEADPRVKSFTAQPFTLEIVSNKIFKSKVDYQKRAGVTHSFYTPDFLCVMDDGALIAIDAKHSSFMEKFEVRRPIIEACLNQHGMQFLVVPDTALSQTVIANISSIHGLRAEFQSAFRAQAVHELESILLVRQHWVISEIEVHLTGGKAAVLAGILSGALASDLNTSLFSVQSRVCAAYGDLSHFQLLELGQ
ncbi:MAG: TnsA endonuclease N-terminal domain-containing protein [Pseudomonas gingeri]